MSQLIADVVRRGKLAAAAGAELVGVGRKALSGSATLRAAIESLYALRAKNRKNRPPAKTDCQGYADNQIWQFGKKLWVASRVYPGIRATWSRYRTPIGDIGNAVATGLIGCYWLRRAVPGYAGPAIKVARESDAATLDVNFLADGSLDVGSLDGFLISSRGLVETFYDQSGLGNHLTAAGAARPVVTTVNHIGDLRAIVFEKPVIYNDLSTPNQYLTIPAGVAVNSNAVSIAALVKFAHTTRDAPIVELAGATYTALGKRHQTGIDAITAYVNSSNKPVANTVPSIEPEVVCLSSANTGINVFSNEDKATFAALGAVALTGGKVGATTSLFVDGGAAPVNGGFALAGLSLYSRGIAEVEYRSLFRAICRDVNLAPQVRGNIVFDGDSLTEGAFATYFNHWPAVVAGDELAYPASCFNVAISGGTTATQLASQSKWLTKIYNAGHPFNLLVVFMGTNDLSAGATGAATYAALKTYIQAATAAGYRVVVATALPRNAFLATDKETQRLAYNAAILAGWESDLGCIGVLDFASETTMGNTANVGNVIYYTDGTHPTDYGYSILANFAAEYLNRVVEDLTDAA